MEGKNFWSLCEDFTVVHASLLIIGEENPAVWEDVLRLSENDRPQNFSAVFTALSNAVMCERLKADFCHSEINSGYSGFEMEIDWDRTTVRREDLRDWLKSRGFTTGFFFPLADDSPDYLDVGHKNYALKLAAAIKAWQAVNENPDLLVGKTVKQALTIWLRKNAGNYGLTKDDGTPNEQGIDEISKISNWAVKGGAPKTPD